MNLRLIAPFLAAVALLAQAPPANQVPTIRVTTRLVEVNVIARDKNGPVRGLTKDDFIVLENGKQKAIAFFSVNSLDALRKPPAPLPPNVFTNRVDPEAGTAGNVTIILIDALNGGFTGLARQEIIKFLGQIRPEDRVGLYVLGNKLRVVQEFTSDSARLVKTLALLRGEAGLLEADMAGETKVTRELPKADTTDAAGGAFGAKSIPIDPGTVKNDTSTDKGAAGGTGSGAAGQAPPDVPGADADKAREAEMAAAVQEMDVILKNSVAVGTGFREAERVEQTVAALNVLARHVARMPGRKTLIWVTSAFPLVNFDISKAIVMNAPGNGAARSVLNRVYSPEVVRASHSLNNANIAVYPVDAAGLSVGSSPGRETMRSMAQLTGGRAFYDRNDIQTAIRQAIDDAEVTYTLGFYPDSNALDSKFHEVKVEVKRPGIDLRYRKGYNANPDVPLSTQDYDNWIFSTVSSVLDSADISLTARIEKVETTQAGVFRITLDLAPADFLFVAKGNEQVAALDIVFAQRSANGEDLGLITNTLEVTSDRGRYTARLREKLDYMEIVEPAPDASQISIETTALANPKASQVRVMVLDRNSGRIGSLAVPLKQ